MPKEYTLTIKVWADEAKEDDGSVGGSSIIDIKDSSGKSIEIDDEAVYDILHILNPHSFKRRS